MTALLNTIGWMALVVAVAGVLGAFWAGASFLAGWLLTTLARVWTRRTQRADAQRLADTRRAMKEIVR
jgi:hypothetical protein